MSKPFDHPFSKLQKEYRKFRRTLPVVVSNIALNDFKTNFKRQGYVNEHGVFIPWRKTSKKKSRTFGRRSKSKGILIGSGRMLRSMRTASTYDEARVVSNLLYAAAHNEGFKGSVNVSSHKRNRYAKRTEKTRTRSGKYRNRTVTTVKNTGEVKAHKRKMNIPKRPFMTTSKTINDEIEKYVFKEIDKIWNS
ncbi:phage virion morphogenesis protein [Tenacibaculum maritimum]|uniref:phage virion morphogenesis protein n=1 Tax=Tenacibaculum maritimum TaxID=107401 RepID=UPI0004045F84|nr:phage virion morphogenesis protein [Tenacibaculum maritimum]